MSDQTITDVPAQEIKEVDAAPRETIEPEAKPDVEIKLKLSLVNRALEAIGELAYTKAASIVKDIHEAAIPQLQAIGQEQLAQENQAIAAEQPQEIINDGAAEQPAGN